jgi:hypothetical protein
MMGTNISNGGSLQVGSLTIGKKKVRFTDEIRGNHIATVYEVESYKQLYGKGSKNE